MPRRHRRLAAGATVALLGALAAAPVASAATMPARGSGDFVDSIGVVTHAVYFDTAYGDWDRVVGKLSALGVRHVRDGLYANPAPSWADWNDRFYRAVDAAAAAGVRFDFVLGQPGGWAGTLEDQLAVVTGRLAGTADSLEAANEPDRSGRPAWAAETRRAQRALSREVDARPALRHLPVIGPSLAERGSRAVLGDLRASLDAGNIHPYTGALPPSKAHLDEEARLASVVSGPKPLYATEVGFHDALEATTNQAPASERAAAIYTLRSFLVNYQAGIVRTFAYELLDEKPDPSDRDAEQHFGLLRNDFSEKPAFTGLANLIAALRPLPGGSGVTRPLEVSTSAATDLRRLLLQRGDGSYALVLWRDRSVWDPALRRDLAPAASSVTVTIPGITRAGVVRPLRSRVAEAVPVSAGRATVRVGADPVILDVTLDARRPDARQRA